MEKPRHNRQKDKMTVNTNFIPINTHETSYKIVIRIGGAENTKILQLAPIFNTKAINRKARHTRCK